MEETPREMITVTSSLNELSTDQLGNRSGISDQSMGATNRVGVGYRTGSPGYIGWRNRFLGSLKV